LTKDNKTRGRSRLPAAAALSLALWAFGATVSGSDLPTNEITSNNIYGLAGNGDTVWMVTDQGVNYTIAATDTLTWRGYRAQLRIISLAFGARYAVACLDTAAYLPNLRPNKLWFFSHSIPAIDSIALPYSRSSMASQSLADSALLMATGVVCLGRDGDFWLACQDGGLVRFDPVARTMRSFFPGIQRSFDPATVHIDSVTGITAVDSLAAKRVIAVAVQRISRDTTAVLVLTRSTLYRFFPGDTSWESLPSTLSGQDKFDKYNNVFACGHSPTLIADIGVRGQSASNLYRFDPSAGAAGAWTGLDSLKNSHVTAMTFGPDSVTYFLGSFVGAKIRKYSGALPDTDLFNARMSKAMGNLDPESINDILYLPRTDTTGSLWIATSSVQNPSENGLFFSRSEERDERNVTPFVYVRRDRKISTGLKETYAVPGILSAGGSQSVFAYSLSKASDVTISVYDWNMNLVKNVVVNRPRIAGKDDPLGNGRSTNRREDSWDGTTGSGKRVAVGVYYFKITAKSGERSFGKIIVAK
jgi:hypothetical protein